MGTGYVRVDTSNNIANGNVINADDLDNEFNGVEAAFNASSGHTHDGTASEGAPITVVGPSQDIVVTTSLLRPKTTNVVDLGTSSLKYKDLHMQGTAAIATNATVGGTLGVTGATTLSSTLAVTGDTTLTGNLVANGNITLGNAATDTVTVTADVASNLIPSADDTHDLGASGSEWKDLYLDGTAYIDTGSIDTANVGTLDVSGNAQIDGNLTVDGTFTATSGVTATSAATLSTARTISLGGDVTGSASFDGSADITITAVIADDSHNHTIANVDGLQAALDAKAATLSDLGVTASATELNYNDITTLGTSQASKVVTADANGVVTFDNGTITESTALGAGANVTINLQDGDNFTHTLSENVTYTFSNPAASGKVSMFSLKVIQDSTARSITWPTSVDWSSATAPTLTTTSGGVDVFVFATYDGGTTYYGFVAGQAMG
jgi:hypothetical protein